MISMVVYSENGNEMIRIKKMLGNIIPLISEEKWDYCFLRDMDSVKECEEKIHYSDVIIFDITGSGALNELERIRQYQQEAVLMLLADTSISPMSYMKPSIKATSLLLNPSSDENMQEVLKEFLIDFVEKQEGNDPEHVFKIETKREVQYIAYDKIFYFEARKRKLYVRTLSEEYPFIDTMDHLEETLGDQFVRCHRSFIVNTRKIVGISLSDQLINLTNELAVPLSRGYRSNVNKIMLLRKSL